MTRRHGEWNLVGYDADPLEASEYDIKVIADRMRERSDEAGEIKAILTAVADLDGWRGKTAEVFADKADGVTGDLGKVVERYEAVAAALDRWKGNVETARDDTWTALKKAEAAQETVEANQPFDGDGDAPAGQDTTDDNREDAEDDIAAARSDMRDAMEALDRAASARKEDIEDAADIWDDGFWGNVKGAIRDAADVIYVLVEALKIIALIVGLVILVLVFTIGAPFALIVVAVALSVAILAGTLMLYLSDTGHYSGADVAWALVDVGLSLVGGKAASAALRGMNRALPQIASRLNQSTRAAALNRLIGNSRTQFTNALNIADPSNNLARWTARLTGAAATEGQTAADDLTRLITTAPETLPATLRESLRNGGRELAGLNQQLAALRAAASGTPAAATLDGIENLIRLEQGVFAVDTANKGRDAVSTVLGD